MFALSPGATDKPGQLNELPPLTVHDAPFTSLVVVAEESGWFVGWATPSISLMSVKLDDVFVTVNDAPLKVADT